MLGPIEQRGKGFHRYLGSALVVDRNLSAEIRASTVVVITESVANGVFRGEDKELIVGEVEAELLVDIVVVVASLVAGTASAVELLPGVDAGCGYVAAVLAGDGVAGSAEFMMALLGRKSGSQKCGTGNEKEGSDGANGKHFG